MRSPIQPKKTRQQKAVGVGVEGNRKGGTKFEKMVEVGNIGGVSLWVKSYLFCKYLNFGAIWGKRAQIPKITCRDTWKIIQSLQLLISHQMRSYSRVKALCGELYLLQKYLGVGTIWGNWAQIPQLMYRGTWKLIQSLQLLIWHQMSPYSSVKTLC